MAASLHPTTHWLFLLVQCPLVRARVPRCRRSEAWVEKFVTEASKHRPAPTEPMIPGVMVTCFDNLTMNVGYKSFSVGGETGEKLDMTNWFAVRVPRALAPSMDGARLFRQGIFRRGVSLTEFCRLFYLDNPEIVGNKKRRWFRGALWRLLHVL